MTLGPVDVVVEYIDGDPLIGIIPLEVALREHVRCETIGPPARQDICIEGAFFQVEMVVRIGDVRGKVFREYNSIREQESSAFTVETVTPAIRDRSRRRLPRVWPETNTIVGHIIGPRIDLYVTDIVIRRKVIMVTVDVVWKGIIARCGKNEFRGVFTCLEYIFVVSSVPDAVIPGNAP